MNEIYPKNEVEFDKMFPNEDSCRKYLFLQRWGNGFICPKCSHTKYWELKTKHLYECQSCNHQTSITSGTILHGTRKPLKLWFKAMWFYTSRKTGISAKTLQTLLGFGSYKTAWSWLQKLRQSSVREGREQIFGRIEVDEAYIGGVEVGGKRGRGGEKKTPIIVAVERIGNATGRIRIEAISDCSSKSLLPFITKHIESGSEIITDGWKGYSDLEEKSYIHSTIFGKSEELKSSSTLKGVHLVISLFKRFILGTYHDRVESKYLQKYLDEFVFRYNRRKSRWVGKKFMRIVQQAVGTNFMPVKEIIRC